MIYISGPITENPDYEEQFADAEIQLNQVGFATYNPAGNPLAFSASYAEYMRRDLEIILKGHTSGQVWESCDGLALLPGWEDSAGAYVEVQVAKIIGIPVRSVQAWVADGGVEHVEVLPDTTRIRSTLTVAKEKADAAHRHDVINGISNRHRLVSFEEKPPAPSAHYRIDGEEIIPLVPPYFKPRGPHEPPETVAIAKTDHRIAEQETRDTKNLPACNHLWLIAETTDGLVKECPNCGETQIERSR